MSTKDSEVTCAKCQWQGSKVCYQCFYGIAQLQAGNRSSHPPAAGAPCPPVSTAAAGITKAIPSVQTYHITPVTKPRQTVSDKWNKRPSVVRYREFADKCREAGVVLPLSNAHVIFRMPMPQSWSKKKKLELNETPHKTNPDWDNLAKALCDAVYKEDSGVWNMEVTKLWAWEGSITIINRGVSS